MNLLDVRYSESLPGARTAAASAARWDALKFRLKAFGFHLCASATVLTLVIGGLYLGWYRWPGWYLSGVSLVALILMSVDVSLGPLLTLLIASPTKPRRELARDIAVIATVQLAALVYGATTLWQGRPLYYVYAVNRLEMIQAAGIDSSEVALMRKQIPELAPTWHSLPRWVSAPYVPTPHEFTGWKRGIPELRKHLKKVDDQLVFGQPHRALFKRKMEQLGLDANQSNTIWLHGRGGGLLAVFDRNTMRVEAVLSPDS
jgi:hypothetical protein